MGDGCVGRDTLDQLHAGELDAQQIAEVEGHLRACPTCQRRNSALLGQYAALKQRVRRVSRAAPGPAGPADPTAPTPQRPVLRGWPEFPGYEIVGELSRGGQGVVYEALQDGTNREVAIKVLIEGAYASPRSRRRFEREIELVASLRHPSIVSVFHAGVTPDGRPFCVMDFVRGVPLNVYVRERCLTLRQTLALFADVCDGVQYAHQRGVMHRDLKPSNVLVEDPFPSSSVEGPERRRGPPNTAAVNASLSELGIPKILDFGLAKQIEPGAALSLSDVRQVMGTLPYMSPEQARGAADEVDTRTDVYSLGVMLYELLTGCYPYPVEGQLAEVLRHIQETPPTPPSRAWSAQRGVAPYPRASVRRRWGHRTRVARGSSEGASPIDDEVRTILMRSLAKERERRYQSAFGLSRDIRRYLAGDAIEAKRDSGWYVLRKTLWRHRVPTAVASAFVGFVCLAALSLLWMYGEQRQARQQAEHQSQIARQQRDRAESVLRFATSILATADPRRGGQPGATIHEALNAAIERIQHGEFAQSPQTEALLMNALGEFGLNAGQPDQAARLFEAAFSRRRELHATDHPDIAESLDNLAGAKVALGDLEAAEKLYLRASDMRHRLFRDGDRCVARSMNNLAALYLDPRQNHPEWSVQLCDEALRMYARVGALDDENVAVVLRNRGRAVENCGGAPDAARAAYEDALTRMQTRRLRDRVAEVECLESLSQLELAAGREESAAARCREALALRRDYVGRSDPNAVATLTRLATCHERAQRHLEASEVLTQALELQRRLDRNGDSREQAHLLERLADNRLTLGRYAAAEDHYRIAMEMARRVARGESPESLSAQVGLACVLILQRDFDTAEQLLVAAYAELAGRSPSDMRTTVRCLQALVDLLEHRRTADPGGDHASRLSRYKAELAALRQSSHAEAARIESARASEQ